MAGTRTEKASIPLTVLGGYLGAGKTTLLNRLLSDPTSPRLAVIVNDFGDLNIDASLIEAQDGDVMSLTNGCVCCSLADALGDGLGQLINREPAPEHIVIEASGVAEPAKVAQYGHLWPGVHLAGIVTVADAGAVMTQAKDKFVGPLVQTQLRQGDFLVVTKTDLLAGEAVDRASDWLDRTAPDVPRLNVVSGALSSEVLLGELARDHGSDPKLGHGPDFNSWTFRGTGPFSAHGVRALLEGLPSCFVRVKGFVETDEGWHLVQKVGRRLSLTPCVPHEETQIVFITVGGEIDEADLSHTLASFRGN